MKPALYCLISLFFTTSVYGIARDKSVAASLEYRAALSSANEIRISEGLPHQTSEKALLGKELERKDLIVIAGYTFYSPAAAAHNRKDLAGVLSNPHSIKEYSGQKLCGGFHPDYCLSWASRGIAYHALICFGCSEIVYSRGGESIHYDLSAPAREKLEELLKHYRKKRPEK